MAVLQPKIYFSSCAMRLSALVCRGTDWWALPPMAPHLWQAKKNGLVALVQRKLEEENADPAVVLHCIIHQQALCGKCLKYEHVMSVVLKCVNYIRSRSLQHRQFRAFLEEIESTYGDVLYFTEVRWLSRGNVLKRFFDLRAELKRFMEDGFVENSAFCKKPQSFHYMQISCGGGHSIQCWWICLCYW